MNFFAKEKIQNYYKNKGIVKNQVIKTSLTLVSVATLPQFATLTLHGLRNITINVH